MRVPKCAQVGPWAQVCPKVPTCSRMKDYARPVSVRVSVETCLYCFCMRGGRVFARRPKCAQVGPSGPMGPRVPTCAHVCTNEMAAVVNVTQLRPCHATNENACIHAWRVFIGGHTCGLGTCQHFPRAHLEAYVPIFKKHEGTWHDVHPGYKPGYTRKNFPHVGTEWAQWADWSNGRSGPSGPNTPNDACPINH